MKELTKSELLNIEGGSLSGASVALGIAITVVAGIVFVIGVVDGYLRPLACR